MPVDAVYGRPPPKEPLEDTTAYVEQLRETLRGPRVHAYVYRAEFRQAKPELRTRGVPAIRLETRYSCSIQGKYRAIQGTETFLVCSWPYTVVTS